MYFYVNKQIGVEDVLRGTACQDHDTNQKVIPSTWEVKGGESRVQGHPTIIKPGLYDIWDPVWKQVERERRERGQRGERKEGKQIISVSMVQM